MEIHPRTGAVPVRRANAVQMKIVMPPVLVIPRICHSHGIVDDIVPHRNVQCAVLVSRIGTPRVVHMQGTRRIETFPQRADLGIYRRPRRAVHENRIQHREIVAQLHHPLGRHRHVGRIQADKVDGLQRVPRKHRRRHRPVKPAALARVILRETHHHRIFAQNHLRQRLVAPRTLEPHQLGTRSHERLGKTLVRRIRVEPHLGIGTEQRAHLELAALFPGFAVIVVVITISRVRIDAHRKGHPVLKIRHVLVPGIAEPAITLIGRNRRGTRTKRRIVATASPTKNMQEKAIF